MPNCKSNQVLDEETCTCKCNNKPSQCGKDKEWDERNCKEVCKLPPPVNGCEHKGQIYDENKCECTCPNEATDTPLCKTGQFFSPKRGCQCVYPCTGKPPADGCPHRQKWCVETCMCECEDDYVVPRLGCDAGRLWNGNGCSCDCDSSKQPTCNDATQYYSGEFHL